MHMPYWLGAETLSRWGTVLAGSTATDYPRDPVAIDSCKSCSQYENGLGVIAERRVV